MTKVIQVIETTERRGLGEEGNPVRLIKQYYSLSGALLFEEEDKWLK